MHTSKFAFVVAAALALAATTDTLSAQKRFDLFQKALAAEKSDGNLNDAITLYQQAIREAGTDRALAAKAWLRIGECYQKLGDKQAQAAFERVAREFTEQTEAVAEARAKLDAMTVSPRSADNGAPRQIATLSSAVVLNGLTPDGHLIGTDWDTGNVIVRDPSGRVTRMIAGRNRAASWGEEPLVSPDRSQLVFGWYDPDLPGYGSQLRLMANEPGAPSRLLVDRRPDRDSPIPSAWSKDGKSILATFKLKSEQIPPRGDIQIAWVSALDGSVRVLKTLESWRATWTNGCCIGAVSLSPDERFVAYAVPPREGSHDRSIFVLDTTDQSAVEVVSGSFNDRPLWTARGDALIFVSNRGGSFGLWCIPMSGGRAAGVATSIRPQIGNVTLQGITPAGVLYYTQNTAIRQVFVADFGRDGRLPGGRLHQTASLPGESPSWSPDGSLLALKRPRDEGGLDLVVWVRETGQQLSYTPPRMGNRKPSWHPDGRLQIITNSPLRVRVDQGQLKTEDTSPVVPLGTLSRDGKTMYVEEDGHSSRQAAIVAYDAATGERRNSFPVPVSDISQPMALSPDGTSFAFAASTGSDNRIVRINVDGTGYRVIYSGNVAGPSVAWSADGTAILFSQNDGSHVRLMRVPVSGGGSAEAVGIDTTRFLAIDASPDGKHIAYSTIEGATEIWALNLPASLK